MTGVYELDKNLKKGDVKMLPIGIQLYSLRELAQKNFPKVLEQVAEMGYKLVEPAGFFNLRPREFKRMIDGLGLGMTSSHSPWCRPGNIGEAMELAEAIGLKRVVCGYGPDDFKDMDAIRRTADATNTMNEILKRNGFELFQHNHDFEFQRLDGRLKYEIYREFCPGVKYEIDCFWSTNLGCENAVEMLKIFAADTILLHMKDGLVKQNVGGDKMVNGILDRKVELLPLGEGTLPIRELIASAPSKVEAVIVELDYCDIDMLTAVKRSYDFMTINHLAAGNR
ncbi:MAG: sugar phosphate isomerase/epimerase [Victivallaceae bacterium]|nr:sugar phosphate isomerase/epimerase [Victivallaceae bacterium]